MLTMQTTFVVGAGASCDFQFPTGHGLALNIASALDVRYDDWGSRLISGDGQLAQVLKRALPGSPEWQRACWRIRDGLPHLSDSIDVFLDSHRDDEAMQTVGRIAIVKKILEYEKGSILRADGRFGETIDLERIKDTWLVSLFRILQSGRTKADVESFFESCSFVIFNYDRCVEYFFVYALTASYSISTDEAAAIVAKARIVHVYGDVGPLPGFCQHPERPVRFGSLDVDLLALSKRISTYTDNVGVSTVVPAVQRYLADARRLVFLGFGFNVQNLNLMSWDGGGEEYRDILATAYGVSDFNLRGFRHNVRARFSKSSESHVSFAKSSCADLLNDHRTALDR